MNSSNIITGSITGITTLYKYPYLYCDDIFIPTKEENREKRKKELLIECENDPELFGEVITELRKRKLEKISNKKVNH